jgi:hypothetical protein
MKGMQRGRVWTSVLAVGLFVGVAGWATTAGATCADLNADGKVNIADAVRLIQAVGAGPQGGDCGGQGTLACGDLDANGSIGISDVVIMLAQLTHNPTLFPLCQGQGNTIACSGGKATISGNVSSTQTWSNACPVYIDGLVFVQPGVTVTIEPGTTVVGVDPPTQNGGPTSVSALIFLRGSKINAVGTPAQPIIMTSQDHLEHGTGHISDWGGLTINGNAPVNCPGGECLAEGLTGVPFGGPDPNDSSGRLEYVRVEFSGKELSPDNELNIITYNGVGAGTVLDHVQANIGFDDCQEWFGGTVNGKFLVDSGCGDDLFDTQLGTTGKFQYFLGAYFNPTMQNAGNNGFEWDDNENGFDLLPRNAPKACNVTLIGTQLQANTINENSEQASNFRRGTAGIVANTIAEHFRNSGWALNDNATAAQTNCAGGTGQFLVEHTLLFDNGNDGGAPLQVKGTATSPCNPTTWLAGLPAVSPTTAGSNGTDPQIPVVYGTGAGGDTPTNVNQFIPAGGSPGVATQPLVNSLAMDCKTIDPFFDTTNYIGALRPGDPASNWLTTPWISFQTQ